MDLPVEQSLPPVQGTSKTNVLAIISLVTGILGLLVSCISIIPVVGWFSLICVVPCGLAAVITGIIGLSQAKKNEGKGKGLAITGIVLGAVTFVVTCLFVAVMPAVLGPAINDIFNGINQGLGQ